MMDELVLLARLDHTSSAQMERLSVGTNQSQNSFTSYTGFNTLNTLVFSGGTSHTGTMEGEGLHNMCTSEQSKQGDELLFQLPGEQLVKDHVSQTAAAGTSCLVTHPAKELSCQSSASVTPEKGTHTAPV